MTPRRLSQTARHSFRTWCNFLLILLPSSVHRCFQQAPRFKRVLSFCLSSQNFLRFFSPHGCAARKIFKSILRPVCLLLSHSPLPATIARLSFCPIARDDAIIGRANTRRPRKITIIPPVVRKIWCARKTERDGSYVQGGYRGKVMSGSVEGG